MDAALGDLPHGGQADAIVDAEHQVGVGELVRGDGVALGAQDDQRVGEVVLALGVVGRDLLKRVEQRAAVEGVDARVDLADGQLRFGRVAGGLGLHDPRDAAVGVADHAAVAGRVLERHRGHRGRGRATRVGVGELADCGGRDKGDVAGEDDHGAIAVDVLRGGQHRVTGAARLGLHGELDAVGQPALERPVGTADDDDLVGVRPAGGGDRPRDHRTAAEVVQHLGRSRAHPGPLSGGEDHDGRVGLAHGGMVLVGDGSSGSRPACSRARLRVRDTMCATPWGGRPTGRTRGFGPRNQGSSPCPPVPLFRLKRAKMRSVKRAKMAQRPATPTTSRPPAARPDQPAARRHRRSYAARARSAGGRG